MLMIADSAGRRLAGSNSGRGTVKLRNERSKWQGQVKEPSLAESAGVLE